MDNKITKEDQQHIDTINTMSQYAMASLYRFAPSGHPYFDNTRPMWKVFEKRFKLLGGMTTEISKDLGWG